MGAEVPKVEHIAGQCPADGVRKRPMSNSAAQPGEAANTSPSRSMTTHASPAILAVSAHIARDLWAPRSCGDCPDSSNEKLDGHGFPLHSARQERRRSLCARNTLTHVDASAAAPFCQGSLSDDSRAVQVGTPRY